MANLLYTKDGTFYGVLLYILHNLNARLQMLQVNSFTPVCTTRCPRKLLLPEKPCPQKGHVYG